MRVFQVHEVSLLPLLFVAIPLGIGVLFFWIVHYQRRQLATVTAHPVPILDA